MKMLFKIFLVLMLFIACLPAVKADDKEKPENTKPDEIDLKLILKNIHQAFAEALKADGQYAASANVLTYLTEVNLVFSEAITTESGGDFSLIIKLGGKRKKENTRSISYSFVPRDTSLLEGTNVEKKVYEDVYNELLSIGTCLEEYKMLPYQISGIELELDLTITKSKEVGAGFEIWSAEIGASHSREKSKGNKMILKFEFPKEFYQATKAN